MEAKTVAIPVRFSQVFTEEKKTRDKLGKRKREEEREKRRDKKKATIGCPFPFMIGGS